MTSLTQILMWLYTQSLNIYPTDFRTSFGDEMQEVFTQAITERSNDGKVLMAFWREIKDLPGSLLRVYWDAILIAIRKEKVTMATISSDNSLQPPVAERHPGSWGAAFLAGLPHLIMGLLIGVGKLGVLDLYQVSENGNLIIGIGLALLVISILLFAWWRGWPLWSASWYLYGTWVSLALISLTIENLSLEEPWRFTNLLFLIWIAVCIVGYFLILSKSRLHGLLSVAFLFPMLSVMMLEFIPNPIEGWFAMVVGLFAALTAGAIVRIGDFRGALVSVLGLNLAVGLAWAYISEYKMLDLPAGIPAHVPQFTKFLGNLALYSIFGLGLVAIPFILRGLWNFGRRKLAS